MRNQVFALISILIGILIPLVLLECILHFLPVYKGVELAPVNNNNPVRHFVPNQQFTWSKGWLFEIVNSGRVNNAGYINDTDYTTKSDSPLLAVIGDSYVEAIMVPFSETITGRLSRAAGNNSRVYSFATSGSALTNYLNYAEFARDTYHPDGIIIIIVGNDFDESLVDYRQAPGFHYLKDTGNGKLEPLLLDYTGERGLLRSFARHSALARYIITNSANLYQVLLNIFEPGQHSYAGNTLSSYDDRRLRLSMLVIDRFIDELPARSGLPAKNITLILDGIRPELYTIDGMLTGSRSFFGEMRKYLTSMAIHSGFELIDMQPRFINHFKQHKQRFEFKMDNHWNSLGHELAAEAAIEGSMFTRTLMQ